MQSCKNCKKQFTWRNIYQSFMWTNKPIHCKECKMEHRLSLPGRFAFVSLTLVPTLIFTLFLTPFENKFATLGIGISILLLGSLISPFFVSYKKA